MVVNIDTRTPDPTAVAKADIDMSEPSEIPERFTFQTKYQFVEEDDEDEAFNVITQAELQNTIESCIAPVFKIQLTRRKDLIKTDAIKSLISHEASIKIAHYNAKQMVLAAMADFDDQMDSLNKTLQIFSYVLEYMSIAEQYKHYFKGTTRRDLILSHMFNTKKVYYEGQGSTDSLFNIVIDIIEGVIAINRKSFKVNFNTQTSCFFRTPDQKKKLALDKQRDRERKAHNKRIAKLQFKLETDVIDFH
ncbi:hypothetical protein KIPB_004420 [Kipferlia bialata]|uniref:Uncharacterized protein n=1 Tax=Kipferlia bialata TaxID=797122 RepID=A0A391NKR0_9EUKA|nr:hypothetical protein KIPB_004420 [Kipferlia bialata]|eukprot:g4420.t1